MKCIIAGSREITDYNLLMDALTDCPDVGMIREIVSGTARGVDKLGERYAAEHDLALSCWPADWDRFGKAAGYKRNEQMGKYANMAIVLWNGSKGSKHMIDIMRKLKKPVYVYYVEDGKLTKKGVFK